MSNEVVNYDEVWAKAAQAAADQAPPLTSAFLSTRGGILAYDEEEMPNGACVIILDQVRVNTFYADKFDPDNPASPICYAFSRDRAEELAPHPSMQVDLNYFQPQAHTCGTCQWNEWGTADKGRGKACQNRVRLALIPAGYYNSKRGSRDFDLEIYNDPAHFRKADIAYINLPVTSGTLWWKYVAQLQTQFRRPPHGVITRMFTVPHPKRQFEVHFEMIEEVPNELAQIVMARNEEAAKAPFQGFQVPQEEDKPQQGSLRGLRRGR